MDIRTKSGSKSITEIIFSVTTFKIFNALFMTICVLVMTLPIVKVFVDSLDVKGGYDFNLIPDTVSLTAYVRIIKEPSLLNSFGISVYVTVVGTIIALFFTTLGAFVLTRKDMPGRNFFMYLVLFTMIFNGGLIPTFMVIKNLHLLNTLWAVILPLSINTYYLVLMKNFFSDISPSIYESAEIDGCTPMGIFFKIILPMSKPAIAAIGLFYFVLYWNDFFHFVIYIPKEKDLMNFQVKLREMVLTNDTGSDTSEAVYANTLKNAVIFASILPVMAIYPFIQRYFVTGLNLGAIKE